MSKYEQLSSVLGQTRTQYKQYEEASQAFGMWLVTELITYFQLPQGTCKIVPTDRKVKPDEVFTIDEAMQLDDDDAYWHLGILLTIYEPGKTHSPHRTIVSLMIKGVENHFVVRYSPDGQLFTVHQGNTEELHRFFDDLFEWLVNWYKGGLDGIVTRQP